MQLLLKTQNSESVHGKIGDFTRQLWYGCKPCNWLLLAGSLLLILSGCADEDDPVRPAPGVSANSTYILCEGNKGADNSTLSRWERDGARIENDVFVRTNPGLRLGDTANDMLLLGDTIFVAVDGSRTIEYFDAADGSWLGRVVMPEGMSPRFLAGNSSHELFVSVALSDCVLPLDVTSGVAPNAADCIAVGSAPEKMALAGNLLAVANSGFGTVFRDHPKAGTVSLVDITLGIETRLLRPGPNTTDVCFNSDASRLYAHYLHLPGSNWPQNDSLAGIVEYSTKSWEVLRHWRLPSMIYDLLYDAEWEHLYTITLDGVIGIDLNATDAEPEVIYAQDSPENEHWYSLAFDASNAEFWIGNARDFVVGGEVLHVTEQGDLLGRYEVGRNPGAFAFSAK